MASGTSSDPDAARRVLLGVILNAHGIRGQVMIKSFTEYPEDVAAYGPLEDEAGARSFEIEVESVTPKGVIARIEGVGDRTSAEKLKGTQLYVPRDALPSPDEDEYYHADLVGLQAVDRDGKPIGRIANVLNFGAGDILEIAKPHVRQTLLWPMRADVVLAVDLSGGTITLEAPPEIDAGDANGGGGDDETA